MEKPKAICIVAGLVFLALSMQVVGAQEGQSSTLERKEPIPILLDEQCKKSSELKSGEASGTIKGVGETVPVRYAYARWAKHSLTDNKMMIDLLITERPIPEDRIASVFSYALYTPLERHYDWLGGPLRGLRFHVEPDGNTIYIGQTHSDISVGGGAGLDECTLEGARISGTARVKHFGLYSVPWSYSISFVTTVTGKYGP